MTKQADLIDYVFDAGRQPEGAGQLAAELLQWMDASSRFTAFVETYRDKIRKKVRVTREPESVLDLRSELEVAYGLLNDRRLSVAYEPYASAKRRGPDFAVTYRANLVFNIEVARIRAEARGGESDLVQGVDRPRENDLARKVERILLGKLSQMQPGMANLLLIHTRAELAQAIDLGGLMQVLKTRAEGKDPAFYTASRYASPAAFYKDFLHLSGILLWAPSPAAPSNQLWVNKQARPGMAENVLRQVSLALQTLPGAGSDAVD